MSTLLNLLLIFLSMVGLADSGYITYEEWANVPSICQNIPGFDCGAVLDSAWAHIGPVPLSVLGFGFYATVFLLATYHLVMVQPKQSLTNVLLLLATSGFLFSLFLVYLQAVVIGAYCLFCMISAITSTLIFFTTVGFWWSRRQEQKNTEKSE
ncbi:vitamin K epoxide reductase family protein [Candidatus Woesebacteria bacterium]|nr:vitamin K epoxide reductase family protein [Candidatus Woesebacteria bacterium]MCD8506814.1 vitamin K epoxide reductase family protein [Candidatus Woesebacteria bacterium]MCD8527568.1 vitamin K epoxide reductase family protein [Candidatus Woesebacteria bacterium]MCD8546308.1 vitamin K epoxide reductase family protein [Candidatus Woesebacteria bacterium]